MVSCQGSSCRQCWIFHGCVSSCYNCLKAHNSRRLYQLWHFRGTFSLKQSVSGQYSPDNSAKINIAAMMLGFVYNKNPIVTSEDLQNSNGRLDFSVTLSSKQDLGIKIATPVGTLVGQLLFGWLADVLGRKRMCKSRNYIDIGCPTDCPRTR